MAVGVDCGLIASEVAALTAGEKVRRETRYYTAGMIGGTLVLSAALNSFAFASAASSLTFEVAGVIFGCAIPCAIFALVRQAASHWLDSHRRS